MATKEILYKLGVKGASATKSQLGGVNRSTKALAASAMKLAAAYIGVRGVTNAIKSSVKAMMVQETAERSLEVALGRNIDSLKEYAAELQQVSLYGDEVTLGAMTMIGAFVKDEEALKKATKATMDLASAKGFDLKTAADLVGKTLGSTTNALTRYGIVVTGAVGSTERLETLVKNVDFAFGGMAEGMVDTTEGAVTQMNNALGDLSETLGKVLSPTITATAKKLKTFFETIDNAFKRIKQSSLERSIAGATEKFAELRKELENYGGDNQTKIRSLGERLREVGEQLAIWKQELDVTNGVGIIPAVIGSPEVIDEVTASVSNLAGVIKPIQEQTGLLITYMDSLGSSMAQAAVYGQKMGQAIVSALKAIAAEILAEIAVYIVANLLGIPIGSFSGPLRGSIDNSSGFLGSGGMFDGGISYKQSSNSGTNVNISVANLIGTDEAAVRDQLIPLINQAIASA